MWCYVASLVLIAGGVVLVVCWWVFVVWLFEFLCRVDAVAWVGLSLRSVCGLYV